MVVTLSPLKTNLAFSDVLLPIAPFSETPGTFVNAKGAFRASTPWPSRSATARPAWKVLRVLANLLGVQGFDFETAQDVARARAGFGREPEGHAGAGAVLLGQCSAPRKGISTSPPRRSWAPPSRWGRRHL